MSDDQVVREQLLALLRGGNSHMSFDDAIEDYPVEHLNSRPPNVPYMVWHIVEHMRITQWDILEFIRDPKHVSPDWPDGYWPKPDEKIDAARWKQIVRDFHADLKALQAMVADPKVNLYAPIPHAPDYNILREMFLVVDHNAYEIGKFAILRQVMGTWPASREP